jgi:hypothetical protein
MALAPCGKCGDSREKVTFHCQSCGHTQWGIIAVCIMGSLISLPFGVGALLSFPADLSPSDRITLNLVAGGFALVGLAFLWLAVISIKDSVKARKAKKATGPVRGEEIPSRETEAPDSKCYLCGKAVHEGPSVEVVSIPISGASDPWAAVEESVDRVFALKEVCVSCHRVFCRECGGEDCLAKGADQALCPKCNHG